MLCKYLFVERILAMSYPCLHRYVCTYTSGTFSSENIKDTVKKFGWHIHSSVLPFVNLLSLPLDFSLSFCNLLTKYRKSYAVPREELLILFQRLSMSKIYGIPESVSACVWEIC